MQALLSAPEFEWADCEALERRHGIGKGCLVVLDVVPTQEHAGTPYWERKAWLCARVPILGLWPEPQDFPIVSQPGWMEPEWAWRELRAINGELRAEFYEGLVAKKADQPYPIQLRGPGNQTPFWVKHRWN